jgi:hypothetical protein
VPEAIFSIPTRQKADRLFESHGPLPAGGSVVLGPAEVAGYSHVSLLAFSDQPFGITVEEACGCEGTFVETATLLSAPGLDGQQRVCARLLPCGTHMRIGAGNLGPGAAVFELCGLGVPQP